MRKKIGLIFLLAGAALIAFCGVRFFGNEKEAAKAEQSAVEAMAALKPAVEAAQAANKTIDDADEIDEEAIVTVDGYDYIGYLSIPSLSLELPVMAEWDYARLRVAPCREKGSVKDQNLVIAAHNYDAHFGRIVQLQAGDEVRFIDAAGRQTVYAVERTQRISPTDVEAVHQSGCSLVLYTCTKGGAARNAVFCNRAE